ncbi:hypothetical protein [uncultured Duncaniella sp.]|uniref:hypothetical protein n=1 Tax=uncultured Duncaniella sp. TaxID=2768039 RepID=UPI00265D731A|nr:hypothetical protein [uncultured Duncaniella sp.]
MPLTVCQPITPHLRARNSALRASLRCRSMWGYHRTAASQLIGFHPANIVLDAWL